MNSRILLATIIGLILLSGCSCRKQSPADKLKSDSTGQIIGGSIAGAAAAGGAVGIGYSAASVTSATAIGLFQGSAGLALFVPIVAVLAPIAGVFIAKGIKNRKEAKRLKQLELQKQAQCPQIQTLDASNEQYCQQPS